MKKKSPLPIKKSVLKTITPNDFGAILEDINGKFSVMVEGLDLLRDEFYRFKDDMNGFRDDMNGFRDDMNGFRAETKSSFITVFDYLSRIDEELAEIKAEIILLKNGKTDKEYSIALEARVYRIEMEILKLRNLVAQKK